MTEEESVIYFYAFRYCLGRMSYAVDDFCKEATRRIRDIGTHELTMMDREITEAQQKDDEDDKDGVDAMFHRLGMACDRADWLKLRETIRKELERRNKK